MFLKRKPTLTPNSNMLVIQPLNASGSSAKKTAKSTPAESELFSKSQDNQTFTNAGDQFDLYIWAQQELSKVINVPPNTADIKELNELAKKIANLWSIINLMKPSCQFFSEEHESCGEYIH